MDKFHVLRAFGLTPTELQNEINKLDKIGYKIAFESGSTWLQGKGVDGIVVFELRD